MCRRRSTFVVDGKHAPLIKTRAIAVRLEDTYRHVPQDIGSHLAPAQAAISVSQAVPRTFSARELVMIAGCVGVLLWQLFLPHS